MTLVAPPPRWDYEADVSVVGAEVLLLDRDRSGQCNTARSGGMIPAGGTRFQRAAGVDDSPENFAREIFEKNHGEGPRELTLHLCRRAPELVEWLVDQQQVELELVTDFKYPGHGTFRMHVPREWSGRALFRMLRATVARRERIQVVLGAAATGLVTEDGSVLGVQVNREEHVRARRTILASNGFGGNAEMVKRFLPEMANALYFGGEASTGEGILWGKALGGALVSYAVIMLGGIQVNRAGRRFADESRGYSEHAVDLLRQPGGAAAEVFDQPIYEQALQFPDFHECVEAGTPIPNLYAGGDVAARISGHGAGGYLSGNGLLIALGFGRLAGEHAALTL